MLFSYENYNFYNIETQIYPGDMHNSSNGNIMKKQNELKLQKECRLLPYICMLICIYEHKLF